MNNKGNLTDERPPFLPMLIGTGFYSGLWPWGPGTAGSILATVIWLLLGLWLPTFPLAATTFVLIVLFTILGTWATARLQPYWGEDPSRVVVDEMVGVWIPLLVVQPKEWAWALDRRDRAARSDSTGLRALPLLRHRQAFGHQEARPQDGGFLGYGR